MKIIIILLTWQRPERLVKTIRYLKKQTYQNFDIHISNGNYEIADEINTIVKKVLETNDLKIKVTHDGNQYFCFRRFFIAKGYAESGYDAAMFLDDDIDIPINYVESFVRSYEPKTYHSAYTWIFRENGSDYYTKRTRVYNNDLPIKYGGAGVSMVDASVFLEKGLFNVPKEAYAIDDLWMSYYCDHVLGWKIKNVHIPDLRIGGGDAVALYKALSTHKTSNKAAFLRKLVSMGWKV